MQKLVVSQKGDGDFTTIQAAIDAVRVFPLEPVTITVKEGIYEEIITVPENKPNISIIGAGKNKTIISGSKYARMKNENGIEIGTFETAVFHAFADLFQLEHLTVQNVAGYGDEIGQALALYAAGDKCMFKNVRLLGNQDTLYTSKGRHYFSHCYIEGHVDFIFGSGVSVFEDCTIHSLRKGYITAASTSEENEFGFCFIKCKLTGAQEAADVYLGRPWRPFAHTVFINTWMDQHIHPHGWDNWRNEENEKTARYLEFGSTGPGSNSSERVTWAKSLTEEQAANYTLENIFHSKDTWLPK
ncbi:pectinesterase family protein [Bacillus sp. REN16]|uniref:pectinesterase family protein n=1 Tax=Bacillus sp. REN16 TaxID=2887296 RepID=UPI001E4B30B2|nr:pectinesterase family protein [Bacillus sp. REN16]MCC3355451.1 pectinesterase family protein [Bacillus sp. REN16]